MKEGFCLNSRRWLSFTFLDLKTCPNEMGCDNCGYYTEREPTKWFKRKKKILMSYE